MFFCRFEKVENSLKYRGSLRNNFFSKYFFSYTVSICRFLYREKQQPSKKNKIRKFRKKVLFLGSCIRNLFFYYSYIESRYFLHWVRYGTKVFWDENMTTITENPLNKKENVIILTIIPMKWAHNWFFFFLQSIIW